MGTDKAWLELNGVPLIVRVLARVRELAEEVLISANDAARFARLDARVVPDAFPDAGPLAGILAGLEAARHETVLVVACDMPFLSTALLAYMRSFAGAYDVVVPQTRQEAKPQTDAAQKLRAKDLSLHPLHAVYSKQCIVPMRGALTRGERRMIGFYSEVRVRVITPQEVAEFDPNGYALWNVNTPDKWMTVQDLFKEPR